MYCAVREESAVATSSLSSFFINYHSIVFNHLFEIVYIVN